MRPVEVGFGGQVSVDGVVDDLFDDFFRVGARVRFGQVEACDLQGVEEQTSAAWVEGAGGDAADDFADGRLNGGAIFGQGRSKVVREALRSASSTGGTGLRVVWWK